MRYYTDTPLLAASGREIHPKKGSSACLPVVCVVFLVILGGCASYRPMPLTMEAVQQKLTAPRSDTIRIKASQIHHPILKPICFDESNGLSPDEAAILALIANPSLKVTRDARGLAAAQVLQAGILPNPQVSYSFETPVGGDTSGKVNAVGLGFEWDISSLVVRDARIAVARCRASSIDLEIAWQEWQVAEAAKLHVYRLFIAKKRLALTEEAKRIAEQFYEMLKRAVTLGVETTGRLSLGQELLQKARTNFLQAQSEVNAERLELNRILGLPSDKNIKLEKNISLPKAKDIPATKELIKDIEKRRLDLLALHYGYESQEERLRAAIRSQFPKISLGLTGARDTDGVRTIGIGISLSLPIFYRGQGRIAIERATRQQLFDEYVARLFEAKSDITKIVEEMHSTLEYLQDIDKTIQELQQLTERYKKATDLGIFDLLDYYQVLLRLYDKKLDRLTLQQRLTDLAIGLEIASGRYIFTGSKPGRRNLKPTDNSEDTE